MTNAGQSVKNRALGTADTMTSMHLPSVNIAGAANNGNFRQEYPIIVDTMIEINILTC